jgi:hypothetical protein
VITFSRAKVQVTYDYSLNGQNLERVSVIRDLGVLMDSKLTLSEHVDVYVSKARQMLGFIVMSVGKFFLDPYALKSLYVSLVRSKLEYASCVWMPDQNGRIARLERVQEKLILYALRRLGWMNMNLLPPYESRCKLLNLDTLCRRREISSVLFVRWGNICLHYGAGLFTLQLHYSYIAAALLAFQCSKILKY